MTQETRFKFGKRALEALPTPDKRQTYYDTQTAGLALRVTPTGTKTFYVIRRVAGMGRRGNMEFIRLGVFPDMTVELARAAARDKLKVLNAGDSVRAANSARKGEFTISDLWQIWHDERAVGPNPGKPLKRSWKPDLQRYERHLKKHAKRRVSEITPAFASKLFREVTTKHGATEANRLKALARAMWNHATKHHSLDAKNPWASVTNNEETSREVALKPSEMPALFKALDSLDNQDLADLYRLCLFTGARSGNVKAMRWEQLDLDNGVWVIPSSHHKNRKTHSLPLPPAAREILAKRIGYSREWVFPSNRSASGHIEHHNRPWNEEVLPAFARELGLTALPDVKPHDLRHTVASWLISQGANLPVVAKALGHASMQTTMRYVHLANDPVREVLDRAIGSMKGNE